MGKKLFTSPRSNTTVETCREWIGKFLQGMLDAGFVQTADTGQVDVSTLELGDTAGSYQYAIFRLDDALQAEYPVFFRVDFSTSTGTSTSPSNAGGTSVMRLTVGKATNGDGVISGVLYAMTGFGSGNPAGSAGATTTSYSHVAFSGDGYAGMIGFIDESRASASATAPYLGCGFLIERGRTPTGEPIGEALLVLTTPYLYGSTSASLSGTNSFATSDPSSEVQMKAINYETGQWFGGMAPVVAQGNINGTTLGPTTSLASGSIGPVFPWDVVAPGLAPWRSCVIVSIPAGDMPGGVFVTNLCGSNGSFYPVQASQANARWGIAYGTVASRHFGVGVRWED